MKMDFRIDWGYQYLYSRRHYHPRYIWDGEISCQDGEIRRCYQLDYPVIWFGPGDCARETLLPGNTWQSATRRGLSGVRIEAECGEKASFTVKTATLDFSFTAEELKARGRLEFPVGPKYLGCRVIVTMTGYYWFLPEARPGEQVWLAGDFEGQVPVRQWSRMTTAWIAPGGRLGFDCDVPPAADGDCFCEEVLHLVCMAARSELPGKQGGFCHDFFPIRLFCDGKLLTENTRYFREHDAFMQMLEDLWLRFQAVPGRHRLEIENGHGSCFFLVTRMTLRQSCRRHGEFSLPRWALCNEPQRGRIYATHDTRFSVSWPGGTTTVEARPGWNDFAFTLTAPGKDVPVIAGDFAGTVAEVYALQEETPAVKVGFDMTVVPHDNSGTMDWLLDYTWRTQLGNLVVFRSFIFSSAPEDYAKELEVPVDDALLTRWGEFCRTHGIAVEAATDFDSGALVRAAGTALHSVGRHEWPGAVYAFDPSPEWRSEDMKSAMEHCIRRLKIEVERAQRAAPGHTAFGDASGGARYCYMAGIDFLREETMVPHTQHLLSQARPAAEVFRNGEWGVHIAIQHPFQPYNETHLGQYFLSLYQAWMMGASMIYEEDSLFELFKEERQAWDDKLTKGKRDMTRDFFRFVKTHPRKGRITRRIAFVEGRYAAPFNGFICDCEQTPDYSVWGLFGNDDPNWGHRQPEKCRQLLDVLMPGASTQPLRQDFTRRRFFFSGTPYGDFDEVPAEATAEYLGQYGLLLHLGWNTMIDEDYGKLRRFVADGGTLLIGLPEFSTHLRRDFLAEMRDLALWNDGDLSEFCGVRVKGAAEEFSGDWNGVDRMGYPEPVLSGIPSRSYDEDGPCRLADVELCGARPMLWDSTTRRPLVVENRYGHGRVCLVTAYAYPGHEHLRRPLAALVARLCGENMPECRVEADSGEIFWNERVVSAEVRQLNLLNTDWSIPGNVQAVQIVTPAVRTQLMVREREPMMLTVLPFAVLEASPELCVDVLAVDGRKAKVRCHCGGIGRLVVHRPDGSRQKIAVAPKDDTSVVVDI